MSKKIRIGIILFMLLAMFAVGFPLTPEGSEAGYADSHPQQSARCYTIGDTHSLFSCLSSPEARLNGVDLVETVGHRIDLVAVPFGYLFIVSLGIFLALACILI